MFDLLKLFFNTFFLNFSYDAAETHFQNALERVKKIKNGIIPQSWMPLLNNLGHTFRKLKKYKEALDFHFQVRTLLFFFVI